MVSKVSDNQILGIIQEAGGMISRMNLAGKIDLAKSSLSERLQKLKTQNKITVSGSTFQVITLTPNTSVTPEPNRTDPARTQTELPAYESKASEPHNPNPPEPPTNNPNDSYSKEGDGIPEPNRTPRTEPPEPNRTINLNDVLKKMDSMSPADFPAFKNILRQYHKWGKKIFVEETIELLNKYFLGGRD